MNHDLEIYTTNKQVIKERQQDYIKQLKKFYPNIECLTIEEYEKIKKDYEHDRRRALEVLMEKSLGLIIESVAKIYARYNLEDLLPIEDALNECILNFNKFLMDFYKLPHYYSEYSSSVVNYMTYQKISRIYNQEKLKTQNIDLYGYAELKRVVDKEKSVNLETKDMILNDFRMALEKASSTWTEQEKKIISMRFGLETGEEMSCQEIAKELGLTRARISDAISRSLIKIRKPKQVKYVKCFNDIDMDV